MYNYMGKTQLAYLGCKSPQGLLEIHKRTQTKANIFTILGLSQNLRRREEHLSPSFSDF